METERMALNQRERDCIRILHEVQQRHLTQKEAARRLQRCDCQVRRLLSRIAKDGDRAVVRRSAAPAAPWPTDLNSTYWASRAFTCSETRSWGVPFFGCCVEAFRSDIFLLLSCSSR
jgi:hypothetical protein